MGLLKIIKDKVYPTTSRYISRAKLLEGVLSGTDQLFRCLFVDNSNLADYIAGRTYEEAPRIVRQWRAWNPSLIKTIEKKRNNIDMCVAVLPLEYGSRFQNAYDFKAQEWVRQVIDTSGSLEEIVGAFHQKKRQLTGKLIHKSGLTYRISNDLEDFHRFYHFMYLPLARQRYGGNSVIRPYEEMERVFKKGFLLLVTEGDSAVSGCLCFVGKDHRLNFHSTGVLDGDESYIKKGAQLALYYFNILYAKEHGLDKVDTMKSRPFLNDGVYRTKREWGATVYPDDEPESWVYFFNLGSPEKFSLFFERNPAVVYTETGLKALVGVEKGFEPTPERKKDLIDRFYDPGLDGLLFLAPDKETPGEFSFRDYEH